LSDLLQYVLSEAAEEASVLTNPLMHLMAFCSDCLNLKKTATLHRATAYAFPGALFLSWLFAT
jgi:hypothetical protein